MTLLCQSGSILPMMNTTAATRVRPDTKDGRWHVGHLRQTMAERSSWPRNRSQPNRWRVRVWRGVAFRWDATLRDGRGQFVQEACPHDHVKQSAARKCAEAAARRWNRQAAQ